MKRFLAIILLLLNLLQLAAAPADTTVYFVNVYPGGIIYELEGHTAIVVDIAGQRPVAYNYGTFDFEAPNFIYRFVKGETDYRATCEPADLMLFHYGRQNRRVVAHRLNFDSARKARLIDFLENNVKPENAVYRYNYVKDNCATRPLRAVELAAGDSVILGTAPFAASDATPTFRNVMRHYHRNYPWYQFGIDICLGSGIDYPLTNREIAFAPAELDRMLDSATVGGRRLTDGSAAWIDVPAGAAVGGPTPRYASPIFVCWLFFAVTLAVTIHDYRRRKVSRYFDAIYFSIIGLTGCVVTFLIFISVHEATSPNWLYLWLNPAALIVPVLIWIKRAEIVLVCYQFANFAVLFGLLACWYFLPQSANPAFLPLLLAEMMRALSFLILSRKDFRNKKISAKRE